MQIINELTELVDIRNLKPHPKNPNRGNADLIAESITENGFYGQIIAQRSTGHILVGHHRLQAAQQLGAIEIPVTWVDVDNTHALKIMLADNATAAHAHRDNEALAVLLSELQTVDSLIGTGYADTDLDALLADIADNLGLEKLAADESGKLTQSYQIVVTLADEAEQVQMLNEFMAQGIECRALIT